MGAGGGLLACDERNAPAACFASTITEEWGFGGRGAADEWLSHYRLLAAPAAVSAPWRPHAPHMRPIVLPTYSPHAPHMFA